MKWIVYTLAVVVFILHQDFWNFATPNPVVLGFLPISAAYHVGYAIACSILMTLMVAFAWPEHLEKYEDLPSHTEAGSPIGAFEVAQSARQQGGH